MINLDLREKRRTLRRGWGRVFMFAGVERNVEEIAEREREKDRERAERRERE